MEDKKKVAIGAGIAGAIGAIIYFATRAKAAPPPGAATLYGIVTDAGTGEPIPDVLVTLNGGSAYTDGEGNYIFEDIASGEYVLKFSKSGYETATSDIVLVEGDNEFNILMIPIIAIITGEIIESYWRLTAEEIQHPHSDPIPYQAGYYMCFRIRNKGNTATSFRMAYYIPPPQYGAGWRYSKPITISPGEEGLIEWVFWAAVRGAHTLTWHLFGDDTQVDSITITNYIS